MTLLAKLTPRGVSMFGPRGGTPEVTAADVCAAIAMSGATNPVQYHLLMIRGADQWPDKQQTELILQEVQNLVVREWNRRAGEPRFRLDKVREVAEAVWREAIGPPMTQHDRAQIVGMTQGAWNKTVKNIHAEALRRVEEQYFEGIDSIKRSVF